jgi:hypothetical protein
MAQKIQVLLICDVCNDGTPGTENIRFGVDGVNYEIDVCDSHAAQLRDSVAPFSGAGRRATAGGGSSASVSRRGRRSAAGGTDRARTQAIRAWAKGRGIKVSERGRISADVAAQYDAAGH